MSVIVNHIPENWEPNNFNDWIEKIHDQVRETKLG